jgi:putative endonuclease
VLVQRKQALARTVDAVGAQQLLRVPRVLASDAVGQLQHVQRAQRDIPQVADGRGHEVERTLRIILRAHRGMRGLQGGGEGSGAGQQGVVPMDRGLGQRARGTSTKALGDAAEDRALAHLRQAGLRLVARNYRTPGRGGGEIDLVMRDGGTLVFVEVRRRAGRDYGGAAGSIGLTKLRRIVFAARHFLMRQSAPPPCRFEVVDIDGGGLQWLRAAFDAA